MVFEEKQVLARYGLSHHSGSRSLSNGRINDAQ
jgi:hypothetical protein